MADSRTMANCSNTSDCFKEAVCINTGRIYDSCSDKDCLEDLQVLFPDHAQQIVDQAVNVKTRSAEIINVLVDVESIPFNQGFYSVDMTFYFRICLSCYTPGTYQPVSVEGLAVFNKKAILYGSEGNVKIFTSDGSCGCESEVSNLPRASVQAVDPVVLDSKLVECCQCRTERVSNIPRSICNRFGGEFGNTNPVKTVLITLGLFTIVQIERKVQMLIPAYDFCMPDKECVSNTDDPCAMFQKIKFPTNEFFPPRQSELDNSCSCNCGYNNR